MSNLKQKILLFLLGGIAFGYSLTPNRKWKIVKEVSNKWKEIDKKSLRKEIRNLYRSKMIDRKENKDGSYTLFLTDRGRLKALTYYFDDIKIKSEKWDGKWRIIIFDIPEKIKKGRDALRKKIKEIGFYELQRSVFVFPYKCDNEINFIIEFFDLRKYVRFGVLESIDNDLHLKEIFELNG